MTERKHTKLCANLYTSYTYTYTSNSVFFLRNVYELTYL